jgi:hypothetical protein
MEAAAYIVAKKLGQSGMELKAKKPKNSIIKRLCSVWPLAQCGLVVIHTPPYP